MAQIAALVALADIVKAGEVPDEKIAEHADCTVDDVKAFRAELEAEAVTQLAAEPDARARRGRKKVEDATVPPAPAPSELERAAGRLLANGWTLHAGELVPPAREQPDSELTIRVTRAYRHQVRNGRGKLVSITIPRSVYRGAMARSIMEKVPPELIERV